MVRSASNRLVLVAGLLGAMLCQATSQTFVQAASSPVASQTAYSGKRWVTFDFASSDASGEIQVGKPLELSIALVGGENHWRLRWPGQARAYWQQIRHQVSRSWSRSARRVCDSPSSETVRV